MPSEERPTGARALAYAELKLGVHRTHTEAIEARDKLDTILTEMADARDSRRDLEEALKDREMELAVEAWSNHPDFSAAKMDGHLKTVRHGDVFCRELRSKLMNVSSDIEGLEYDKQLVEVDIKIAVSRLQELGGYFNYLAAVKQAETAKQYTEKPEKPE